MVVGNGFVVVEIDVQRHSVGETEGVEQAETKAEGVVVV